MTPSPTKQTFNPKIGAWVKYKVEPNKKTGGKFANFFDIKQKDPMTPFKGIPKK